MRLTNDEIADIIGEDFVFLQAILEEAVYRGHLELDGKIAAKRIYNRLMKKTGREAYILNSLRL